MIVKNYIFGRKYSTLKNGLLHAYRYEETDGTTCYDSHGSINGTYEGGILINQTSPVGKAVILDGVNDYVRFNDNLDILSLPCAVTLLVYLPNINTTKVLLGGTETSTFKGINILQHNANVYIRIGNGVSYDVTSRSDYATTSNPLTIGWNTIIVNFNNLNNYDVFVNNNTLITLSYISGTASSIGFSTATYVNFRYFSVYYQAGISEMYIHNRVLTNSEILELNNMFNSGKVLYLL